LIVLVTDQSLAQQQDSSAFKPHGNLWGLAFGDYVYKVNADTAGAGLGRGGNQYSKMPAGSHFYQFRRIYLGYNYDINPRVSAEVLLASEDDFTQGSIGNQTSPGDVLQDNKLAPFLKLANVRIKSVFPGTDVVLGEMLTPAFPLLTEVTWGYRSLERTAADMRKVNSYDQGIALQGKYMNGKLGFNAMVGNGTAAKPVTNPFPMFYGDVWVKIWKDRIIVDLYQDYQKIDWDVIDTINGFHHDRNMTKFFVAYSVPKFTVGIEAFRTTLLGDIKASTKTPKTDYLTTIATTISMYARGRVYKDVLGFVARYDIYNPGQNIKEITDNTRIIAYNALSSNWDPTTKEKLLILGLDYTPYPNLHIIPNFYMNTYQCTLPKKDYFLNPKGSGVIGADDVLRVTVYFIFGKKDAVRF